MIFLRSIALKRSESRERLAFPFTVPAISALSSLELESPVTFFVGENGSGKSTLLEGIAAAVGLPAVGTLDRVQDDATLSNQRRLGRAFRLTWGERTHRGFFLRAEDFFGFTKTLARMRADLMGELEDVSTEYADRSAHAQGLREGPLRASLADMEARYGADLDANSHGQSFLKLFQSRLVPRGLYLLDEPEAPLSPQSQLGLIAMLKEMVASDSQFIIATHSPILLAFPGATIYSFDEVPVRPVPFEELEHVTLTKAFLNDPERFLRLL